MKLNTELTAPPSPVTCKNQSSAELASINQLVMPIDDELIMMIEEHNLSRASRVLYQTWPTW